MPLSTIAGWMLVFLAFAPPPLAGARAQVSTIAPLAAHSLLLDARESNGRMIAVGERGHVLISTDQGRGWRQVVVPTRNTLTGIAFSDPQHAIAVGHFGTILRTKDAGETWERVESDATEEDSFLDVICIDPRTAFAVGAYGLFMATTDGGATWERRSISEDGFHFNRISRGEDGLLYLVGEAGTLQRSADMGVKWEPIPTPYEGSFFGFLDIGGRFQIVCGLRGNVFRSTSSGDEWEQVDVPTETLLMSAAGLPDGRIVIAGQSGDFLLSADGGASFELWEWGSRTGVAEVLPAADGALVVFGEAGVTRVTPPPREGGTR